MFVLIGLAFTIPADAQTSSIAGSVQDAAGSPVAGASVTLRNRTTGLDRIVSTDSTGKFEFRNLGSGPFELIVSATGFARIVQPADNSATIVTLQPETVREEVTVVSGSRQEELRETLSTKVDVLTATDLKNTGYETVGEALREVPGVITRRGSETSPVTGEQIQGIDSRQVLVLLDGQPVIGARGVKSGIVNLDRQSVGRLESVEVVKGASSALYGSDAIGGVINLRSREQTTPFSASAQISGGNFGALDTRGRIGFTKNKLSGVLNVERHKNNGFDLFPADFTTDGSGYHRYDLYGKIKYQFAPNFAVLAFANGYWNNSRGRVVGEPTNFIDLGQQINDVDDDSQNYGITADWAIDGKTSLQVRGYLARYDEIYRSVGFPSGIKAEDGNLFERYGKFDFTFSRIIGESHFVQAGAEFVKNKYSGLFRLQNDRGEADTQTVWAQDKINLFNRVTFTAGGRVDHHSIFGTAASPRFGLNYRINDNVYLRASWGRGFRAPDLGQLFYKFSNPLFRYQVLGNKDLSPEHSGSWQVGGEYNGFSRRLRFGVNLFRNDVRNLINSQSLGTFTTRTQVEAALTRVNVDPTLSQYVQFYPVMLFVYRNLANVYTQGIEADVNYVLPHGFSVAGAYTFLEANDKRTHLPLTYRHKHHGFMKIAYDDPRHGFTTNFRGTFFGNYYTSATNVAPAFQLFDIYASKSLIKGFEVFGSVDNLFDSKDPNAGKANPSAPTQPLGVIRAEAGRSYRVGLRWSFDRK